MALVLSSRLMTAFTILRVGQFTWNTTPQGLIGAPASFYRLMDIILGDMACIVMYLEDVLIHTPNHVGHIWA